MSRRDGAIVACTDEGEVYAHKLMNAGLPG
jgi:hypothetical protein